VSPRPASAYAIREPSISIIGIAHLQAYVPSAASGAGEPCAAVSGNSNRWCQKLPHDPSILQLVTKNTPHSKRYGWHPWGLSGSTRAAAALASAAPKGRGTAMSLSGMFANVVALVGDAAIRWRRLQGTPQQQAVGPAPAIPAARPQGSIPT